MMSILSLNDKTASIQLYQKFFIMCIDTTFCDLLSSYFN